MRVYKSSFHNPNTLTSSENNLTRRRFMTLLTGSVVGVATSGCGGGGSKSKPTSTSSGTAVSVDQRFTTFDQLTKKIATVQGMNAQTAATAVADFMRKQSGFSSVQVSSDLTITGVFHDNTLHSIMNNAPTPKSKAAYTRQFQSSRRSVDNVLPTSTQVRLINSFGPDHDDVTVDLASWFQTNASPVIRQRGSVEELKNVSDDGVFFYGGHGGVSTISLNFSDGSSHSYPYFHARTSTVVDEGFITPGTSSFNKDYYDDYYSLKIYKDKLPDVPRLQTSQLLTLENGDNTVNWGFTATFVSKYMKFPDGCLIYFHSCSGSVPEYSGFVNSFGDVSGTRMAAIYAGWDNTTRDDDAALTARFMFDRMLGANRTPPLNGVAKLRPTDMLDAYAELTARGLQIGAHPEVPLAAPKFIVRPTVRDVDATANTVELRPNIQLALVEDGENIHDLELGGKLGTIPGLVSIGGVTVKDVDWTGANPVCHNLLPSHVGDLVVDIGGRRSNTRQITLWAGTFTYAYYGLGSLKLVLTWPVKFRGDVGSYRDLIANAPAFPDNVHMFQMDVSNCHYESSGSYQQNKTVTTWQDRSGTVILKPKATLASSDTSPIVSTTADVSFADGKRAISLISEVYVPDCVTQIVTVNGNNQPEQHLDQPVNRIRQRDMYSKLFAILPAEMNVYNILDTPGGDVEIASTDGTRTTLGWSGFDVQFTPDEISERHISKSKRK